jgi:aminoglycoside phosphotransferase family enzyme/predicted kinase
VIADPGLPPEPADPDEVRAALTKPSFYPSRPSQVVVCETHISWVFLAGDRAYKLKKPVVLTFVDYGSPERRRELCHEEVRLNRRLAPEIYLGVRAVAATTGGFELAAEDDPGALDYLVEMRRYDEGRTLAERLGCGELRAEEVQGVGRLLAGFHRQAPEVTVAGVPALSVERRIVKNLRELLELVEQRAEIERVLVLARFAHAFVVAHEQILNARARRGLVREVHGDLRAEHVLLGDPPQIVDCVEFEPGLRELDVADDLAFLVMDLTARGGERFARTLIDSYREHGGDPGEESLVAFYAVHRALVRAKVELVRAAQAPDESAAHGHHCALARDLLALAERFGWRARLPLVIVICGAPASGKSELARAIAAVSDLAHLSSDVARKRLAGIKPTDRAPAAVYDASWNARTYTELGRRAGLEVSSRGGALVDATFRRRADREAFARGFAGSAPVLFVECHAPGPVLAERAALRERETDRVSDATLPVVVRESARWEPLEEVPAQAHVTLRSDRPVEAMLADLLALLDSRIGIIRVPA